MSTVADPPAQPVVPWARRIAREWLWFVGTVLASVIGAVLFSAGSDAGGSLLMGTIGGVALVYPGALILRLTWWSLKAVRPPRTQPLAPDSQQPSVAAALTTPSVNTVLYVVGACFLGLLSAVAQGFDVTTAEGLGAAFGAGPILGLIVGGIRRLFGPTSVVRWMFWVAVVSFVVNGIAATN